MAEKMLASQELMVSVTDKNEHGNVSIRVWSCVLEDHIFCNCHSPLACLGVNGLTPGIIPRRLWSSDDKGCEGKHYRNPLHTLALFVVCPEGLSSTESS